MRSLVGGLLKFLYRLIQRGFVLTCILPFFFSKARRRESFKKSLIAAAMVAGQYPVPKRNGIRARVWFHAASVGELECLWPVVFGAVQRGDEIIVTILSESARSTLEKLRKALAEKSAVVLYAGYCPWEGQWRKAIQALDPSLFMTAKYEAWPDLWVSLSRAGIPLAIVSVQARKSLQIAKFFCRLFACPEPELILFPAVESDQSGLRDLFPDATILVAGEPRWERVFERSQLGSQRAKELIQIFQKSARPWGVLGSAWEKDLQFLGPLISKWVGTLWVVPHRIDSAHLEKIESVFISLGIKWGRTSRLGGGLQIGEVPGKVPSQQNTPLSCIIVDEMGFLSELYSVADWAYVGGGFGVGIHSTIEPAIHGIPIAVGPNGTHKFSEVGELTKTGQLTILRTPADLISWGDSLSKMSGFHESEDPPQSDSHSIAQTRSNPRSGWKSQAVSRLGATQKILAAIEKFK